MWKYIFNVPTFKTQDLQKLLNIVFSVYWQETSEKEEKRFELLGQKPILLDDHRNCIDPKRSSIKLCPNVLDVINFLHITFTYKIWWVTLSVLNKYDVFKLIVIIMFRYNMHLSK